MVVERGKVDTMHGLLSIVAAPGAANASAARRDASAAHGSAPSGDTADEAQRLPREREEGWCLTAW